MWLCTQAMAVSRWVLCLRASLIRTSIPDRGGIPRPRFNVECKAACESVRIKFLSPWSEYARPIAALSASAAVAVLPGQDPSFDSPPPLLS